MEDRRAEMYGEDEERWGDRWKMEQLWDRKEPGLGEKYISEYICTLYFSSS